MIGNANFRSGDKANMFVEEFKYNGIVKCKQGIEDVMREIRDHRKEIRLTLRLPALDYSTVLGTEVCKPNLAVICLLSSF